MTEYAKLVVSVDSRQVKSADSALSSLSRTAGTTEKSTDQLTGAFRRLAGPLAAVLSARQVAQASEAYVNLTNRLRNVTDSSEELANAQDAVFRSAQEARQPLDATAELYQRIATNADALGLSASGVAGVVDTINKTLAISGTSAASASGALTQLGQAFASGALRGEELNSVLENAPALAKTIADGLGVTTGELRALGQAGALSAENLIEALQRQGSAVDDAFGNIQASGGQALTVLGNSLTKAVGEFDQATGASSAFANSIISLSGFIDRGGITDSLIEGFTILRDTLGAVGSDIQGLGLDLDATGIAGESAASFIGTALKEIPVNLRAAVQIATIELASLYDNNLNSIRAIAAAVKAIPDGLDAVQQAYSDVRAQTVALGQARADSLDAALQERQAILDAATAKKDALVFERDRIAAAAADRKDEIASLRAKAQASKSSVGAGVSKEQQAAQKQAIRDAEALQKSYESQAAALTQQIALFGQTTEAARVGYSVQQGDLSELNDMQKERLLGLAAELDAKRDLQDLERIRIDILRETGQIKAANDAEFELDYAKKIAEYEKQGNVEALQRLETLRQIREVQATELEPGTVEGVSKAPGSTGLDASVGGANSELERLQEEADEVEAWRAMELEKQRAFLEAKAINSEEFAERERNINTQARDQLSKIETAKNQAILASSGEFFGQMASLSQSGNKKLGAVGKAAAIAQATISGFTAIQNALAVPPYPVGLALAVSAGVATAANIASIAGVGFSQGGYTGPGGVNQPAGTVHKGEVVWSQADIRKAGGVGAVEAMRTGQDIVNNGVMVGQPAPGPMQSNQQVNNINVNVSGVSDSRGMRESSAKLARDVATAVQGAGRYR
jgi:tape measure domain-containing protein